jgi:NOL1/NOP2/fmu family ribosome biogenesis protein
MQKLKVLNSRERKNIYKQLFDQFGHESEFDVIFLLNSQKKVYLMSKEYIDLDITHLRINNKAMYFGKLEHDGLRLSIDGSQMLKPTKNIIELDEANLIKWMQGEDILFDGEDGYYLVKHGGDIFGCGSLRFNNLRNMVPKERRLHSVEFT